MNHFLWLKNLRTSQFAQHVGILAAGTLIAQAISVFASPLLTRIYTPEDYAAFALFTAITSSLAPGISGRYDFAIVVTKSRQDSQNLMVLAFWVSFLLCVFLFILMLVKHESIRIFLKADALGDWLLLTPFALFFLALVTILRHFANSEKNYHLISRLSVFQVIFSVVISIVLGLLGFGSNGLIIAFMLGLLFAFFYLIYCYRTALLNMNWYLTQGIKDLAIRYKDYPIFNAPSSFLNGILLALPIFFLTKYFSEDIVGYYALITRVATAPLSFIASSVSQITLKKIAELVHSGTTATAYIVKLTFVLTIIVSVPTVFFMLTGASVFAFVFGENWRIAGELLVILMPSFALKFVVSTLSSTLLSTGHLRLGSFWQIIAFILILIMFIFVAPHSDIYKMFIFMLITDLFLYTLYYFFILYAVRKPKVI